MLKKRFLMVIFSLIATGLLIHVSQANNSPVLKFEHTAIKNSFTFVDSASPYLTDLRVKFDLDRLTSACRDDLEKTLTVMNWVHSLWKHHTSNRPVKSDPVSILEEVFTYGRRFRCTEYSYVTAGCLNALGVTARYLELKTADVETRPLDAPLGAGHVAVEVYLSQLNKWVMIDPQFNLMPIWNGLPLNAVEFQQVLAEKRSNLQFWSMDELCPDIKPGSSFGVVSTFSKPDEIGGYISDYLRFIEQYLFYFDTSIVNCEWAVETPQENRLMLVPLGAKNPTIFQIEYPLTDLIYTNNYNDFYQKP